MEMSTTEKSYLSVDGISETFACHHKLCMACAQTIPLSQVISLYRKSSPSPNRRRPYKTHAQHLSSSVIKVSNISKASMDIIKTVRARWTRQEEKIVARSSSAGYQHPSDQSQQRSVEPLAALKLQDETRRAPLEDMGLTKPRNCRRIVVLGAPKVGKTNILQRFLGEEFEDHYEPTTEDFHRKLYHIRGETYQIDILDAAGERDFPAKRRLSILTGDIFLLVFSVNDRGSFNEVCEMRNEIKAAKTKLMKLKDTARAPIIICGNKIDLDVERVVNRIETRKLLGEDAALFETSAKDGTGLEDMFRALAKLGGLPNETSPSQHQTLSIHAYQSLCTIQRDRGGSRALGLDAPCAAVYPLARRPSFTSDLRQVLGPSTKRTTPEKCQIQ